MKKLNYDIYVVIDTDDIGKTTIDIYCTTSYYKARRLYCSEYPHRDIYELLNDSEVKVKKRKELKQFIREEDKEKPVDIWNGYWKEQLIKAGYTFRVRENDPEMMSVKFPESKR